uniref:Uncharacterized protein n=1 Tax=Amphimedon queenslandica TaxID=400682 RepID=A0A1X7U0H4_AMPQE
MKFYGSLLFYAHQFQPRNRFTHKYHVEALSVPSSRSLIETAYGLHSDSFLHQSQYFHVTQELVPDIMHDVLEGCLPYEMKEMLKYFIDQKLLTLSDLNDLIRSFPYGKSDVKNKPALITLKTQKSSDHLLKQTASQCWCLGRLLHLMIGHIIPVDNDHWINFCLLLTNMDYLLYVQICSAAIILK